MPTFYIGFVADFTIPKSNLSLYATNWNWYDLTRKLKPVPRSRDSERTPFLTW